MKKISFKFREGGTKTIPAAEPTDKPKSPKKSAPKDDKPGD